MALVGGTCARAGLLAAAALTLAGAVPATRAANAPSEYEVKAAYLYNFARFVEWPAAAGGAKEPFLFGVLGDDPFGTILDRTLEGKTIGDRALHVRRLERPEDASRVQVLFISPSEDRRLDRILGALAGASVLTVSDMEAFAERGGMIAFRLESNKVRLDINMDQAARSRLKMSSQLLKLARIVRSQGGS